MAKMKPTLDSRPVRTNLTSREIARILGGTIGAMLQLAEASDVRAAIHWWGSLTDSKEDWDMLVNGSKQIKAALAAQLEKKE